ncbi:MAG TPA: DNA-3-methyladenine glycosylase I, partial [Spirochaetia bacterium]|nr:DNA-3-methyladenine glycosylase I [Spirochaetia bacterium]
AFDNFDPERVARYGDREVERLLGDAGIVRNRLKILAAINNAQRFLEVQAELGSFDRYLWGFVDGETVKNRWKSLGEIPPRTELSDRISKDLKSRGFKFVGSTIVYSHLQAVGIVNDHITSCFRYKEVGRPS